MKTPHNLSNPFPAAPLEGESLEVLAASHEVFEQSVVNATRWIDRNLGEKALALALVFFNTPVGRPIGEVAMAEISATSKMSPGGIAVGLLTLGGAHLSQRVRRPATREALPVDLVQ